MLEKKQIVSWLKSFQTEFITALEGFEDTARFSSKIWSRPGGGGGDTRVIQAGNIFEKGGVNFSEVSGELPPRIMEKLGSKTKDFYATGVSIVIHPVSPCVPTVHANFRYFEQPDRSWFGGGADLTPYVYAEKDFQHFHRCLKKACDSYRPGAYSDFKKKCDEYFRILHRDESRGIGGIFFDYLSDDMEKIFQFVRNSAKALIEAYIPIVEWNRDRRPTERQKKYQLLRRGRYVEFNLVYDRGTLFGLETKGNIESILMSLPAVVNFDYAPDMEQTDDEKKLAQIFKNPKDWV